MNNMEIIITGYSIIATIAMGSRLIYLIAFKTIDEWINLSVFEPIMFGLWWPIYLWIWLIDRK